ncbi:MAG: type II CAAX endopeptidase family protein [bacterium]|nr:type II CAAX endopeptidase family protein [bacterium]
MKEKINLFKDVITVYVFVFIVWGFYRYLFRLPDEIEEIILKPLVWLGPVIWFLFREKANLSSIGWTTKNLFKNIYFALFLGIFFAILGLASNLIKYQSFSFSEISFLETPELFFMALGLSLITAISEETVFRGYLFSRLWHVIDDEWFANLVTSLGWVLIHLPIAIFVFHYEGGLLLVFLLLNFIFGLGAAFVFARTKAIIAPVLLHVFWSWPIILFR